jgi:RepB plasmid partitioning protein
MTEFDLYTDRQIAPKIGVSVEYIHMIGSLLEKGEERLVTAVEAGILPLNMAIEIAKSSDEDVRRALTQAYARKIVYRMQRFPASGIYGCDVKHKTLWDEFCYETQHGPIDELRYAWDQTLGPYLDEMIKSIPATTAVLLSIFSCWELKDSPDFGNSIWPDGMKEILEKPLINEAMNRGQK